MTCEHRLPISGDCTMGCLALCERGNERPRTVDYSGVKFGHDEMLPASNNTMGKAYEEIGRGDPVWQDEAGNWHLSAGQVVRFHAHNGTMGVPPERLLASGQSNWTEEDRARLTEWTEPCHEMPFEGIQAPAPRDYPLDVTEVRNYAQHGTWGRAWFNDSGVNWKLFFQLSAGWLIGFAALGLVLGCSARLSLMISAASYLLPFGGMMCIYAVAEMSARK